MYNFFKNKKELLKEMMMEGSADIAKSMESYSAFKDPAEAIRVHITETIRIIKKKKEFWRLLHAIRLQNSVLQEVEHLFATIVRRVTLIFEKVFRTMKYDSPKLEAQLFLTQIDGLVILYLQNEKLPIDKLGQQLLKRYTR
jgi:hypothetical protein